MEVINPIARSQWEISPSASNMLNASYIMALRLAFFKNKIVPSLSFFWVVGVWGDFLCSAMAAHEPASMAICPLDEPQPCDAENQDGL